MHVLPSGAADITRADDVLNIKDLLLAICNEIDLFKEHASLQL